MAKRNRLLSVKKWQLKFCRKHLITIAAPLRKTKDFYKKVLLNELKFSGNKKVSFAALNLSAAFSSEWLFSARLRYMKFKFHSIALCKENRGLT